MADYDDELEGDVIKALQAVHHGAWITAAQIGLEVGFERCNAASCVSGVLRRLLKSGVIEQEKTERPIIYRLNQQSI